MTAGAASAARNSGAAERPVQRDALGFARRGPERRTGLDRRQKPDRRICGDRRTGNSDRRTPPPSLELPEQLPAEVKEVSLSPEGLPVEIAGVPVSPRIARLIAIIRKEKNDGRK